MRTLLVFALMIAAVAASTPNAAATCDPTLTVCADADQGGYSDGDATCMSDGNSYSFTAATLSVGEEHLGAESASWCSRYDDFDSRNSGEWLTIGHHGSQGQASVTYTDNDYHNDGSESRFCALSAYHDGELHQGSLWERPHPLLCDLVSTVNGGLN